MRATHAVGSEAAPRVIVAQLGARRRYAVPRMLEVRGVLEALYTDVCFPGTSPVTFGGNGLGGRVARRTIEGVAPGKIYRSPWVTIGSALQRRRMAVKQFLWMDDVFGQRMIKWGLGSANTVYGMYGSGTPFWRHARARGLKVACDMFITPMWHDIVCDERSRFPDWEEPSKDQAEERTLFAELNRRCVGSADLLICPSETVRDGVRTFLGTTAAAKIAAPQLAVVSYGAAVRLNAAAREPQRGRILFAGSAELRKGIHTLAVAERLLNSRHRRYEFRVAGQASDRVRAHPQASGLHFLGHLSRASLDAEYAAADVLVLPTLAEGSPAVVHEALALGLPVVTTRSAGSVVTDGREGRIVPERDAEALSQAIAEIVENRARRAAMSAQALETASRFDEGPWADRLMAVLETLHA